MRSGEARSRGAGLLWVVGPVSATLHQAHAGQQARSHGVWGNWQPDGFWPR